MLPAILFIFVLLIMTVVVPASIAYKRRVDAFWSEAAVSLGLGFQPSGFFQRRRITGRVHDLAITLDTFVRRSGKSSQAYTRLDVAFPKDLVLGLRLTRSGFSNGVAKLFGAQEIAFDGSGFDSSITIKGADPHRVRTFLTAARRARIYRLLGNFSESVIDDRGIRWQQRGIITDATQLVRVVRRFQGVAWRLVADRHSDRALTEALTAADDGRPGEALKILETARAGDPEDEVARDEIEEDIMRGHLLHLAGRHEEAQAAFSAAAEAAPEDIEAERWASRMLKQAPASASERTEDDEEGTFSVDELCQAIFRHEGTSFEATRRFERQFQGKRVIWKGQLRNVARDHNDFVFEGGDACKAVLEVTESDGSPFARREVMAVIQLPAGEADVLRDRIGDALVFSGRLYRIDSLLRNIYLDAGRVDA